MDPIEPWVDRDELRRLADALLVAPAQSRPDPPNDAAYGEQFEGFAAEQEDDLEPPSSAPDPAPAPEKAARQAAAHIAAAAHDQGHGLRGAGDVPAEPTIHRQAKQVLANARQMAQRGGMLDAAREEASASLAPAPTPPPREETKQPVAAQLTQVTPVAEAVPVPAPTQPAANTATPFLERLRSYGTWLQQAARSEAFFLVDREGGVLIDEVHSPKLQQVARTLAQASRTANRQAGAATIGNLHIKVDADRILEVVPVTTRYGPLILGIIMDQPLGPANVETVARALQQVVDGNSGL